MLKNKGLSFEGKNVVVSGSGNVAIYAAEKAMTLGAKVIAMSDSSGYVVDENGINLDVMKEIKEVKRGRIHEYAEKLKVLLSTLKKAFGMYHAISHYLVLHRMN